MAYNKRGYYQRAEAIRQLTAQFYEPERHDRCYKWVWRRHIFPRYGICYNTYLTYLYAKPPREESEAVQQKLF